MASAKTLRSDLISHALPGLQDPDTTQLPDYDEDEPTCVMEVEPWSAQSERQPTMLPPRVDEGDVYMLTRQHLRFKAGIVPLNEEHVDLANVLKAPPSLPPCEDFPPESHNSASLAPVAMDAEPAERRAPAPQPRGPHPVWPLAMGTLAAAAIALIFIPVGRTGEAQAQHAPAAQPVAAVQSESRAPVELEPVDIEAAAPRAANVQPLLRGTLAPQPALAPVAQEPEPPLAAAAPEPPPPPPPAEVEAPAFDKSAANAAILKANRSASQCREEGSPNFPFNLSVTFAPSGQATRATVDGPPYAGTPVGSCLARVFRTAKIEPFSGAPVIVRRVMQMP